MADTYTDRYPSRTKTQTLAFLQIQSQAKTKLIEGYEAFLATEKEVEDGKQDCSATIHYMSGAEDVGSVSGATGEGNGHAEMSALYWFLSVYCKGNHETFGNALLEVECLAKSCCMRCSAILGLLGVWPRGETYKAPKHMGGTQWGLNEDLAKAIAAKTGVDHRVLRAFGSLSQDQIGL